MIDFVVPFKFIPGLTAGTIIRTGVLLKDASTGQIIGHLKEAGEVARSISNISPFDPIGIAGQIVQAHELGKIKESLEALQLVSSIGAVASVATLGICAAGFTVLYSRLNKLDEKLDTTLAGIASIKDTVNNLDFKWETFTISRLKTASDHLEIADLSSSNKSRDSHAGIARSMFSEMRNYYLSLLKGNSMWTNGEVPIMSAAEFYSRYILCCMGHLHAEFILNDIDAYENTLNIIRRDVKSASTFDQKLCFRNRHDLLTGGPITIERQANQIIIDIKKCANIVTETNSRIDTMLVESSYIKKTGVTPREYAEEIRQQDSGVWVIPSEFGVNYITDLKTR